MNKEFIISKINDLIEAHRLWDELSSHIFALGGELWETKYTEAYNFHEELVYDLILLHRGFPELSEYEFEYFQEIIFDLARNNSVQLTTETGIICGSINNAEELYDWMLQINEDFIPSEKEI